MSNLCLPFLVDKQMEDGARRSSNPGGELAKDGRKISVGDCALFQASKAPPFIGIIRSLSVDIEGHAKLGVNWLYRPPDVKLGKGVLLEAAPNEIFYSFHKDEIPATSLLHPCKVAFLRKGVELPSGVCSFVCRRVYDTASKCLWWLTDRDYSNEHQEEVDQLLNKTGHEMQVAMQAGGSSTRALNVHIPSQQVKSSSENIQTGLFLSQDKGMKRECADQDLDPVKRERTAKLDDSDAGHLKRERTGRPSEITKITDKDGSLENSAGVEHLLHLMKQEIGDSAMKGTDLASWRMMLVGVIANTNQDDCLSRFVQLGGLLVMDDWLQVHHKGKSGEAGSPKEGDKIEEELLLMLLRALNRLPVDLNALKTCNVGKSVNHLRSHKNVEIKKRARFLVDTWKKRVAAEMNNDTNSGLSQGVSCPCKQALGEEVHVQCKGGGSADAVLSSSSLLTSSLKAISSKSGQGEIMENSTAVPPGSVKVSSLVSSAHSSKDSYCKVAVSSGAADLAVPATKEEKDSNSIQPLNISQSWSSWPGQAAGSACREDSKSAKASSSGLHHRISNKGILGYCMSGNQKEVQGGKSPVLCRHTTGETASLAFEKGVDSPCGDNATSERSINRLPNTGHGPIFGMPGNHNRDNVSHVNAATEVDTKLQQRTDIKGAVTEEDDIDRSSSPTDMEHCSRDCEESGKQMEICETDQSSALVGLVEQVNPSKGLVEAEIILSGVHDRVSTSSIESCSKHSESIEAGMDEGGKSLSACAAACENSTAFQVPVTNNAKRTSLATGKDDLDCESESRCPVESSLSHPGNNAENASTVGVKKEKDGTISSDHPDTACNQLANTSIVGVSAQQKENDGTVFSDHPETACNRLANSSTVGASAQQKDVLDISTRPLISTSSTDLDTNGFLAALIRNTSCAGSVCEPDTAGDRMGECPPSQEVKPSLEVQYGPKAIVAVKDEISDALEEPAGSETCSGQKMSFDKEQSVLHVKSSSVGEDNKTGVDAIMEDDMEEEGTQGGVNIVVGHDTSIGTSDAHINDATKGAREFYVPSKVSLQVAKQIDQDVEGCGISVYSKSSDKGDLDVSTSHHLKSDLVKDSSKADAKQECNSEVVIEDRDEDTESPDFVNDIQKIVTVKREDMELEITAGPGEKRDVKQAICISISADEKIVTPGGSGLASAFEKSKNERSSSEENEDSGFHSKFDSYIGMPAVVVFSETLTQQVEKPSVQSVHAVESDANEHLPEESMMGGEEATAGSNAPGRPEFDLNEGVPMEDLNQDDASLYAAASTSLLFPSTSVSLTAISSGLATPIAVVAATKGPFIPPVNAMCSKEEQGWKGSAATSAFRPAEPQRTTERPHLSSEGASFDAMTDVVEKGGRFFLDIDLNVADKRVVEDANMASGQKSEPVTSSKWMSVCNQEFMASTSECTAGKLYFDLNCVDESDENGLATVTLGMSADDLGSSLKTVSSGSSYGAPRILRDFDLNDGPSSEDAGDGSISQEFNARSNASSSLQSVAGMRVNGELVNGSSWLPFGNSNTFSTVAIPMSSSARTEQPCPVVAATAVQPVSSLAPVPISFSGDLYKGEPVLASGHAAAYSKSTTASFMYNGSPFGSRIPFTSNSLSGGTSLSDPSVLACFPAVPSQFVGSGAASSAYPGPYRMIHPDLSSTTNHSTWSRPNLDLNAGPETVDLEAREQILDSRHPAIMVPLEHKREFHQAATSVVPLKRKEPEGGWDLHKTGYRQSTW
eukprot:Gb_02775 [translate_table: standard]